MIKPESFYTTVIYPECILDKKLCQSECTDSVIFSYYFEAGLLRSSKRSYFLDLYCSYLSQLDYLIDKYNIDTVIELGSGLGSLGIYFGINNIKYLGFDMDLKSIEFANKRVQRYSSSLRFNPKFSHFDCSNIDDLPLPNGRNLVISQFSFNMMDPVNHDLIPRLLSSNVSIISILDGNPSYCLNRFAPPSRSLGSRINPSYINTFQNTRLFAGSILPPLPFPRFFFKYSRLISNLFRFTSLSRSFFFTILNSPS